MDSTMHTAAQPELTDSLVVDPVEVAAFLGVKDPRFFDHEYRRFRPDLAVFIQARLDGRILGTQGLVPIPLSIGGRPVMSGRTEWAVVDPMWRTGGLFAQLMRSCASRGADKGYDLLWGGTHFKVPFQRNGFLFFARYYEHALLCLAPSQIAEDFRRQQRGGMRAAKLVAAGLSVGLRAAASVGRRAELDVVPRPRGDGDVDELYKRVSGRMPLVVMRHLPAFVEWLLDGPRKIERFYAYDGHALAAYAYVDVTDGTTATILDFAARDAKSMRTLIRSIARGMAARGVAFLYVCYNVTNPLLARQRRWLVLNGFVPVYRGGGFVVRPLRCQDYNYLGDLSRWYITMLWNELHALGHPGHRGAPRANTAGATRRFLEAARFARSIGGWLS